MESNVAIRLKHFMDYMKLSNSQFADACQIPRPSLSQLLGGRNKKISDVMIGQVHRAFPKLSVSWLLFAEGEMFSKEHDEEENAGENPENAGNAPAVSENSSLSEVIPVENAAKQLQKRTVTPAEHIRAVQPEIENPAVHPRKISHITVYYDDSTFESFYPAGRQK